MAAKEHERNATAQTHGLCGEGGLPKHGKRGGRRLKKRGNGQGKGPLRLGRLFAMMGVLYAWATKEYLLEKMSFGQIVMYLNYGILLKYGKQTNGKTKSTSMIGKSAAEIKAERDKLRKQFGENIEGL